MSYNSFSRLLARNLNYKLVPRWQHLNHGAPINLLNRSYTTATAPDQYASAVSTLITPSSGNCLSIFFLFVIL